MYRCCDCCWYCWFQTLKNKWMGGSEWRGIQWSPRELNIQTHTQILSKAHESCFFFLSFLISKSFLFPQLFLYSALGCVRLCCAAITTTALLYISKPRWRTIKGSCLINNAAILTDTCFWQNLHTFQDPPFRSILATGNRRNTLWVVIVSSCRENTTQGFKQEPFVVISWRNIMKALLVDLFLHLICKKLETLFICVFV